MKAGGILTKTLQPSVRFVLLTHGHEVHLHIVSYFFIISTELLSHCREGSNSSVFFKTCSTSDCIVLPQCVDKIVLNKKQKSQFIYGAKLGKAKKKKGTNYIQRSPAVPHTSKLSNIYITYTKTTTTHIYFISADECPLQKALNPFPHSLEDFQCVIIGNLL